MAENDDLLALLEAHGRQFMSSFDSSVLPTKRKETPEAGPSTKRKKQKIEEVEEPSESEDDWDDESDGEWHGFDDNNDEAEEEKIETKANVIVFSDTVAKSDSSKSTSKAQMKAFMSSKVARLREEPLPDRKKSAEKDGDEDDDKTNAQNDALLHRLIHTKILSGSLDPDLDLTPAQRRKALAGRILEAAGKAKLGKGENAVRAKERNRQAKHVRDGLVAKQKERHEKQLEEAKHMGNYHPALKRLFEEDSQSKQPKKREHGLKMGVGSFSKGTLRLSRQEIASVTGRPSGRGKGPRRGGKR